MAVCKHPSTESRAPYPASRLSKHPYTRERCVPGLAQKPPAPLGCLVTWLCTPFATNLKCQRTNRKSSEPAASLPTIPISPTPGKSAPPISFPSARAEAPLIRPETGGNPRPTPPPPPERPACAYASTLGGGDFGQRFIEVLAI